MESNEPNRLDVCTHEPEDENRSVRMPEYKTGWIDQLITIQENRPAEASYMYKSKRHSALGRPRKILTWQ
jgi:hypothetical protein